MIQKSGKIEKKKYFCMKISLIAQFSIDSIIWHALGSNATEKKRKYTFSRGWVLNARHPNVEDSTGIVDT